MRKTIFSRAGLLTSGAFLMVLVLVVMGAVAPPSYQHNILTTNTDAALANQAPIFSQVTAGAGGTNRFGLTIITQALTLKMQTGSTRYILEVDDTNGNPAWIVNTNGNLVSGTNANGLVISNSATPGTVALIASNKTVAVLNGGDGSWSNVNNVLFGGTLNGYNLTTTADALTFANHNSTYSHSVLYGAYAGYQSPTWVNSVAYGYQAGYLVTNGNDSVFVGHAAGRQFNGEDVVGIGYSAAQEATNCGTSVFIGYQSGYQAWSNLASVAIGVQSAYQRTNGAYSTHVGYFSGYNSPFGSHTAAIGYRSGAENPGSYRAVFLGTYAGYHASNSAFATMLGQSAGEEAQWSTYSLYAGTQAGQFSTNSTNCTFVGPLAGDHSTNTEETVLLGYGTGGNSILTNCVGIGRGALANNVKTQNVFRVQQTNVSSTPLIEGNFSLGTITVPNLTVTSNTTVANLTVQSNLVFQSGNSGTNVVPFGRFFGDYTAYTNHSAVPTAFTNFGTVTIPANLLTNDHACAYGYWEVDQKNAQAATNEVKVVGGGNTYLDSGLVNTSNGTVYVYLRFERINKNTIRVGGGQGGGIDFTGTQGFSYGHTNSAPAKKYALDTGTNNVFTLQLAAQAVQSLTNVVTEGYFQNASF